MGSRSGARCGGPAPGSIAWAAGVALIFIGRLSLTWWGMGEPAYFFPDSASHVLNGWWNLTGVLESGWRDFPLAAALFGSAAKGCSELFYGSWLVNTVLAALAVSFLYSASSRIAGRPAAATGAVLALSLPGFSRLVFSGQPEMMAIALAAAAFWLASQGIGCGSVRGAAWDAAALAALGLSLYARPEMAGFLLMYSLVVLLRWRASAGILAALAVWTSLLLWVRFPALRFHGRIALTRNPDAWTLDFSDRVSRIPSWLAFKIFPFNALMIAGWGALSTRFVPFPMALLCLLALGQGLLLWGASWFYLFSWETERNLTAVLFLGMSPLGTALYRAVRETKGLWRAAGLSTLVVAVAYSWAASSWEDRTLTGRYDENRQVGRELRRWVAPLARGDAQAVVVVEAVDNAWPNILVFSAIPDRIRLIATHDVEWGRPRIWDGSGRVVAVAVSATQTEEMLRRKLGPLRTIATTRDYRICLPSGP